MTNKQDKNLTENEVEEAAEILSDGEETSNVFKLSKPVLNNGEMIEELHFDFDKLTGLDALSIESELTSLGKPAIVPAASAEYLARMAVLAVEEPITLDFMKRLNIMDFNKILSKARFFLMGAAG